MMCPLAGRSCLAQSGPCIGGYEHQRGQVQAQHEAQCSIIVCVCCSCCWGALSVSLVARQPYLSVPVLSCVLDDVLRSRMLQVNTEIVNCQKVVSQAGQRQLQKMLQNHVSATGSRLGQSLLDSWEVSDELGCASCM